MKLEEQLRVQAWLDGELPAAQAREMEALIQQNQQALQQIRAPLFEDKVVDYILELSDVSEKEVSKDELQKAVEALDEE